MTEIYEFWGLKLTKEQRAEAINLAWDGMEKSQAIIDNSTNKRDRMIACAMYEAFWCMYRVLTDDKKKGKNCDEKTNN